MGSSWRRRGDEKRQGGWAREFGDEWGRFVLREVGGQVEIVEVGEVRRWLVTNRGWPASDPLHTALEPAMPSGALEDLLDGTVAAIDVEPASPFVPDDSRLGPAWQQAASLLAQRPRSRLPASARKPSTARDCWSAEQTIQSAQEARTFGSSGNPSSCETSGPFAPSTS